MATSARRRRLRRSDCSGPGLRRIRRGRGFVYVDEAGRRIDDPQVLARVRDLAIPPAWREVWICPDPMGHLQATGTDNAGRKQYVYHPRWRERRDREKFRRMISFARALPRLRRRVASDLDRDDPSRERILACAVRLLDVGLFRIGGEEYAENGGGLGLATIQKQHVKLNNGSVIFDYPAKGGARRIQTINDAACAGVIRDLMRRRGSSSELLAYRNGHHWVPVRSDEINDYLKRHAGEDFSAKDFRTWHATVLAATALAAGGGDPQSKAARRRTINQALQSVAELLGNTPAVARRAYIDPRVFDRYLSGHTIPLAPGWDDADTSPRSWRRLERAVLELLGDGGE